MDCVADSKVAMELHCLQLDNASLHLAEEAASNHCIYSLVLTQHMLS